MVLFFFFFFCNLLPPPPHTHTHTHTYNHFPKTPITQDRFAWHACGLIHCDSFLFLLDVERNRNGVTRWKTLFTNVASACPVWSSGLFLLHYMAGNRSWLGLARVLPPPWRQPSSIIVTAALYSHSLSLSQWGLQPHASFHAWVQTEEDIFR